MTMAKLEIAAEADPTLVLLSLAIATYLERHGLFPDLTKTFHEERKLTGAGSIRLVTVEDETLVDHAAIQYLADVANKNTSSQKAAAVNEWVKRSESFAAKDFSKLRKPLEELHAHLTLRTHVVGYHLSVADLAVWSTIRANRVALSAIRRPESSVYRWYSYIEASTPWLAEVATAALTPAQMERAKARAAASAAGASYEIDFPQTDGPIVTRFPPEPSGYLHIGHVKAAVLNDYFAHKQPGGMLICRFDDTNPTKESIEFQDAILEDLKSIDIIPDKISYSSDYFQVMYGYAIQIITDGKAFADDSQLGKGDDDRKNRLPSKRRELSIEETLARFEEMKSGSQEGQRWCLRARIAYDSPNGTLRDPVVYRCNLTPHHRTGTKWRIYPTYDFCAPILDSIEGVTVALRTNEYRDRNAQYAWMQSALCLREVPIWDFSRMNFVRTVLSKRKLSRIVADGKVWGWDDPRMPTVRGILRRGVTVAALREFILKQGPSRNILNLEWGSFWAINKKYIDPVAPRHTAIVADHAVHCHIRGIDGPSELTRPKHLKNTELSSKTVVVNRTIVLEQADARTLETGEEITLMNWGNAYVRNITRDPGDQNVTEIDLELHLEGDVKKTKKLTWLAAMSDNLVPVDLVSFDYLITKDKLDKDDNLEDFLTPVTEFRDSAFADCNVGELSKGAIIQFDRKGFYRLDVPYQGQGSRMVFFNVPTGKS
ncbi:glutamyl-tRNA synthetase [Whalleya microplaca]|nr:glutamyl-tRNA synthetase [Whalleya microplaca]